MAVEREKRFLLKDNSWRDRVIKSYDTQQGYLSDDPKRVVRVRTMQYTQQEAKAWLTIKGPKTNGTGIEIEYDIPYSDAIQLFALCRTSISKTRHIVDTFHNHPELGIQDLRWEIDEFHGHNSGLVIAEVEFDDDNVHHMRDLILPDWIGRDITNDVIFANSNLAMYPYNTWGRSFA